MANISSCLIPDDEWHTIGEHRFYSTKLKQVELKPFNPIGHNYNGVLKALKSCWYIFILDC